jgi:hypothetical protein
VIRIYDVQETQWGFNVVGPSGHTWVCSPTDNRARATAIARALERAYVEGQKEVTQDKDLLFLLTVLGLVGDPPEAGDMERVALLRTKAQVILRKIERLKFIALKTEKRIKTEADAGGNR